jgi:hypothetical protein
MKAKIVISVLFFMTLGTSCLKELTDDRNMFIGSWYGVVNLEYIGLDSSSNKRSTQTITKETSNPKQINITDSLGTATAIVDGKTYTYNEFTRIDTIGGQAISVKFTGTGSINSDVNVVTEFGTIKFNISGKEYVTSWSCIRYRQ